MKTIPGLLIACALFVGLVAAKKPNALPTVINTKTCTYSEGCTACIDVCKTDAIKKVKVDGKIVLVVDPALCEGEGDCIDVCPPGSMTKSKPPKVESAKAAK